MIHLINFIPRDALNQFLKIKKISVLLKRVAFVDVCCCFSLLRDGGEFMPLMLPVSFIWKSEF